MMGRYMLIRYNGFLKFSIMLIFVFVTITGFCGAIENNTTMQGNGTVGTDISINNASARIDVFDTGDIPLGTIPEESLVVSVTVKNNGKHEALDIK